MSSWPYHFQAWTAVVALQLMSSIRIRSWISKGSVHARALPWIWGSPYDHWFCHCRCCLSSFYEDFSLWVLFADDGSKVLVFELLHSLKILYHLLWFCMWMFSTACHQLRFSALISMPYREYISSRWHFMKISTICFRNENTRNYIPAYRMNKSAGSKFTRLNALSIRSGFESSAERSLFS